MEENITGKKITDFAYPFGNINDFNESSKKIAKELGFNFSYSNTQILAKETKDRFCIPRINVRECTVLELSKNLKRNDNLK